jgi:hypothetical protein
LEVLKELLKCEKLLDVDQFIRVNVDQFYGIEIVEFPSKIAQVAMWLMDHQMNTLVRNMFGRYFVRIPLNVSASIYFANAFDIDWERIVAKNELSYILGNPPFLGARVMNAQQKSELAREFCQMKNYGNLDYVTAWYKKAAVFIQGTNIEVAFVSTNSICQGAQVAILWRDLINQHNIKINFAHQTFKWGNEAKGNAAVHCVIIGFGLQDRKDKRLFLYEHTRSEAKEVNVKRINPYLVEAENILIESRAVPICDVPEMFFGNMPNDGGQFLLDEEEKKILLKQDVTIKKLIRPFLGAVEFINGMRRYCIWLKEVPPDKYNHSHEILRRIAAVKRLRENSPREETRKLAALPMLFGEIRQPESDYLLIPSTSSEKRKYVPIGFINKNTISSNANLLIPNATLYHFGILTSAMHNAWMRHICGRLEIDYRYSISIVYNNFPFPNPTNKQKQAV